MEGGVHRGRLNGTILLLMCMFIPMLMLVQPSHEKLCPDGDILTDEGICCPKCPSGYRLVEKCLSAGLRSNCTPCEEGLFMEHINYEVNCRTCRRCKARKHEVVQTACGRRQNTICRCEDGYYKFDIDGDTYECRKCRQCGPDEKEIEKCTPANNTVCECKENYYRVKGKCERCNNCTTGCKHLCSPLPPLTVQNTAPGLDMKSLLNLIAGVTAAIVVVFAVAVAITHMVTKWSTKKRLLGMSSQSSDVSTDSCKQVLIDGGASNNNNVKATPESPVTEHEQPSNLPDCVPFEIKIPDLIYTVLDLVPVLQVKQLVRSLGVRDTEIEQAELDHHSCREAHYQMLRVWAERGSRAGGTLHWPLLQDMLDELRKMHLGRAAEELETKYGIQ